MLKRCAFVGVVVGSAAVTVSAAPTLDGVLDAGYPAPAAVQTIGTQFGNSTNGATLTANGSELDNAHGFVEGGNLYLFLAGNLQSNFNKLEIFIDSGAGGQNQLRGDNPDVDFNGLNRMGNNGTLPGLKFDAGFEADHYIVLTNGDTGGGTIQYFANYAPINTGGGGTGVFVGGSAANATSITGSNGINIVSDNSNTGGVSSLGNPNDSDPAAVATGFEFQIPLSVIGNPTGPIKVTAFINSGPHDFASNQFLGGLPAGTGNLGEPRSVDLSALAGDQFFTIPVPEPMSMGCFALAALGLMRRKR